MIGQSGTLCLGGAHSVGVSHGRPYSITPETFKMAAIEIYQSCRF